MFFDGRAGPTRRVALGGRSRQEETRDQVLERTRLEREKRQRARLEFASAVAIQARWRAHAAAREHARRLRDEWDASFAAALAGADGEAVLASQPRCLGSLLFFFRPADSGDARRLALACRALCRAAAAGSCPLLVDAAAAALTAPGAAQAPAPAPAPAGERASPSAQQLALARVCRLARICLSSLGPDAAAQLSAPLAALAGSQAPAAALAEALLRLCNPDGWRPALGGLAQPQAAASAGAGAVLAHLYHRRLYAHLGRLLALLPPGFAAAKSSLEVLATQLTVRAVTLHLVPARMPPPAAGGGPGDAARGAMSHGVSQLLLVPDLWARCASLAPVSGRLCALAVAEVARQPDEAALLAALPHGGAAGGAALAAWVGNLLAAVGSGVLLKGADGEQGLAAQAVAALALLHGAAASLAGAQKRAARLQRQAAAAKRKVPAGPRDAPGAPAAQPGRAAPASAFVPGAGFVGAAAAAAEAGDSSEDGEAMDVDAASKAAEQPVVAASAYEAEGAAQHGGGGNACLALLAGSSAGTALLRRLVVLLLPATSAEESGRLQEQLAASARGGEGGGADAALLPGGAAQQQLCALLWQLSRPKQYRQRVWLGLSVGARLVPRLWFSHVLPLHAATPGGLLALPGGGWVQPLLVLAQAYSAALSFTHVEDFYAESAPLVPLRQLYDPAAPSRGLLLLFKSAVWQVLWCDTSAPAAPAAGQAAAQRAAQALKRSLGELGGLLLSQLHDRNCSRAFCPPEAFLADSLPPGRLLQEVAARGGIEALIGAGGSDDDDAAATPWEQQQQWQRARQAASAGVARAEPAPGAAGGAAAGGGDSSSSDDDDDGGGAGAAGRGAHQQGRSGSSAGGAGPLAGGAPPPAAGASSRVWLVLQHAPCLIPFSDRVQLFQDVVSAEKEAAADAELAARGGGGGFMFDDPLDAMMMAGGEGPRFVTIRRDQLLDDSFSQLSAMDPDRLKGRLRISYVNEAGVPEAGIDGGGLFKDFMEELLKQGFSPQSHLFAENPQHQLYPSPAALGAAPDAEGQLQFLGRMLGKSLYEGMLLELPLARFFLKKMRGGVCDINDLPSLDPEVYTHLLALRHYTGDFAELSLTFTVAIASAGGAPVEVPLKPGGREAGVTRDNVIEYVHRLADFRLNRQMDRPAAAFLRGFFELIKPRWVRMFNEAELQMLISGSEEGIDVADLEAHVNYAGGYHEQHPVIGHLWAAVRGFSPAQQRSFLKFVTSCSRAPLLGFGHLEPRLCVQMAGSVLAPGARVRLPTAATCMNLLKLPPYASLEEMRAKLLYAITAGAGFELS
ncbi:UPL6 [Scenedesmus sp. PABB004]|nr:UPL6 [Scenedesmus sp. PABB004]